MNKAAIVSTFFLIFLLSLSIVYAQPMPPHQYYGDVTVNGQPAADNLLITAKVDGDDVASTVTKDGRYGYDPIFYIPNTGITGETVKFYVQNIDTGESVIYATVNTAVTELDLSVEGNLQFCGDGTCNGAETCSSCPSDCGQCSTGTTGGGGSSGGGSSGGSSGGTTTRSTGSSGIVSESDDECVPDWECAGWTACISGIQRRECVDLNRCGSFEGIPPREQECIVTESATSLSADPEEGGSDGENQGELDFTIDGDGEDEGFVDFITGAVIGRNGAGGLLPLLAIGLLVAIAAGGMFFIFYKKKKSK